jgi:hypothetical protein
VACRGEFPHLQRVLDKFQSRNFAILAVNLEPKHDEFVEPLLQAMGIRFVALKSNWDWASNQYGVQGTPENFLIDGQGRIMFRPTVHDDTTQLLLEREVEALLERAPPK